MRGQIDIKNKVVALVMIFILIVLLYTWFLPTLNGSTAMNNTSTLWLAGVNYSWFAGVIVICILAVLVLWIVNEF